MRPQCAAFLLLPAEEPDSTGHCRIECDMEEGHELPHVDDAYGIRWAKVR